MLQWNSVVKVKFAKSKKYWGQQDEKFQSISSHPFSFGEPYGANSGELNRKNSFLCWALFTKRKQTRTNDEATVLDPVGSRKPLCADWWRDLLKFCNRLHTGCALLIGPQLLIPILLNIGLSVWLRNHLNYPPIPIVITYNISPIPSPPISDYVICEKPLVVIMWGLQ